MWKVILEGVWLVYMSLSDIRCRHVPLWMIAAGGLPFAAARLAANGMCTGADVLEVLLSVIPGAVLLLLALTRKAGWGDGVVVLLLGLADGAKKCMLSFAAGIILMAVFSLAVLLLGKVGKETRVPCLPFLTVGKFLCELLII